MTKKVQLRIEGMKCKHCAEAVSAALRAVPGVLSAHTDFATGIATVEKYDDVNVTILHNAVASIEFSSTEC